MKMPSSCSVCIEGACQDRSRINQPARTLQEQQQEAGSSQVLQLPRAEKAAGSGAGTGGALQRHHCHSWSQISHHINHHTIQSNDITLAGFVRFFVVGFFFRK